MTLHFEPITLDRQHDYLNHFNRCSQKTSDYSFMNLWGWAQEYGLNWAWSDGLVWIRQTVPEDVYWAPVGHWADVVWERCFQQHLSPGATFRRIPDHLLRLWEADIGHRLAVRETKGDWDYIYSVTELIELKGKRFHKKNAPPLR